MEKRIPTIRAQEFKNTPRWRRTLSGPFIWAPFIPMLLMDLFTEIYHHVCFPLYGLKLIPRKNYFFFDRNHLNLTWSEKISCLYCGYANGLAAYMVAIAGETEAYWCAIKHSEKLSLTTQPHTKDFIDQVNFK